ncbi:hypothetical protein Tco_1149424 [Tanacetum coccineum]
MDEQSGALNIYAISSKTFVQNLCTNNEPPLQQQLDAFHDENTRMTEAYFEAIAKKSITFQKSDNTLSLTNEEVVLLVHALEVSNCKGQDDEKELSGKTIVDEFVGIEQNEPVYFNMGKSLNLVVTANDVGNNGFSAMDHRWSQLVNTFEWGSGSVRSNLGEPNILAKYGNDMGITNYGLRLKDEAIKKLKERTQMSKKRLKIWDPEIKRIFKTSP